MAEEEKGESSPEAPKLDLPDAVIDEAGKTAAGTRKAVLWIGGALGGIPGLAIIGSIVRAPGDPGFDPTLLVFGILVSVVGALIGVLGTAAVITPIPITDADLEPPFDLRRVPGHSFETKDQLRWTIDRYRRLYTNLLVPVADARAMAKRAEAIAESADASLAQAKLALEASPQDPVLLQALREAQAGSAEAHKEAGEKAADAAVPESEFTLYGGQLQAAEAVRARSMQLAAADQVGARFSNARALIAASALIVAFGIFLLAMAPKPKSEETKPTLVTLTLDEEGKRVLDCQAANLTGVRIGGTESAPLVVTLPQGSCDARLVQFHVGSPEPLGSYRVIGPLPSAGAE